MPTPRTCVLRPLISLVSTRCAATRQCPSINARRAFATHRETPASSLLSHSFDTPSRSSGSNTSRADTLGPFPLGLNPNPSTSQTKQKPWKELSTRGKVARGTARTSNLGVILIGGAFTCVLAYALATELFAKNSPTRLYDDACQRLAVSPEVSRHLKPPLRFHINAPLANAPRHRNRHVSHQVAVDSNGKEHLLMHFFVESVPQQQSDSASQLSLESINVESIQEWALSVWGSAKQAFAYLVGVPQEPPPYVVNSKAVAQQAEQTKPKEETSSVWSFAGLFSGLRGSTSKSHSEASDAYAGIEWTEGEVHADLVKDESGNFQYRYLLVDIPNSRGRRPLRVYVEKGQGFREGEGVFIWG